MVEVLGHVARLEAGLLHHEVAHRMQVAMAAGQVTAVGVLVARGGHFLLGRHHRAAFTASILLGLLRVEQVLLELLGIERVGDLLGNLACTSRCRLR